MKELLIVDTLCHRWHINVIIFVKKVLEKCTNKQVASGSIV
jgi:hypothetical protein